MFVGLDTLLVRPRAVGMQPVVRKIRMVPVDQRIVESDADAFGAESVDEWPDEVLAIRSVGYLEVRVFGVPKTESVKVLGRDDKIFHSGSLGCCRPFGRIVQIGVKILEITLVSLVGHPFAAFDTFATRREAVNAPVDEQSETVVCPPGHALGFLFLGFSGP